MSSAGGDSVTSHLAHAAFDDLLAAARRGGDDAGKLLEAYRPYLLAIAAAERPGLLVGKVAPSDLVQETILKGYRQLGAFQGTSPQEFAGWLRQILIHHVANTARDFDAQKRQVSREEPLLGDVPESNRLSPSAQTLSREEWERLEAALARIPEHYREVLLLRHRENLSFVEIGAKLGKSDEAVRKLWTRGVEQMQRELGLDESSAVFRKEGEGAGG